MALLRPAWPDLPAWERPLLPDELRPAEEVLRPLDLAEPLDEAPVPLSLPLARLLPAEPFFLYSFSN